MSEHLVISEAPDVVFGYVQLADSCHCEIGEDHSVSDLHRHVFKWKTPTHMECHCGAGKRVIA